MIDYRGRLQELVDGRRQTRSHIQTRIGLVVPDLSNIATDPDNAALYTILSEIGTINYLDQTEVDAGEQDWSLYDLIVVGSDVSYAFALANIDDLKILAIPILVCNDAVAAHLELGTGGVAQSPSDTTEYCKTLGNRVMASVFSAVGDQAIFDSAQVSDRLDMSNANLTELLLMTSLVGDTNTTAVLGWLPFEDTVGTILKLEDGANLPAGRVFGGCFLHAANLSNLGITLLQTLCRNIIEAVISRTAFMNQLAAWLLIVYTAIVNPTYVGGLQIAATTIDLDQAAGAKDLFTGMAQDVVVEKLVIRIPADVSGGAMTSLSIQTDDTTNQVFIDATIGAKANLTAQAQLSWTGAVLIKVGKKIQLTITGAATGIPCDCDVIAECRAVVAGGYLG